jgi:hypothetical protein
MTPTALSPLLHFSEDPTIERFVPHRPLGKEQETPRVWAIDDAHAPLYWFPRNCPRVAWWALRTSTADDVARWLGATCARMVLAMESGWLERLRACRLFAYRFDPAPFVDLHDHGCHVSFTTVTPLGPPEPVGDLLQRHADAGVELRLTPSLRPLERTLPQSTLHWSFLRMRNAAPEPAV